MNLNRRVHAFKEVVLGDERVRLTNRTLWLTVHENAAGGLAALLILGLACVRFRLNAGYLVFFSLGFIFVASAWAAFFNLRGMKVSARRLDIAFAKTPIDVTLVLQAPCRKPRRAIEISTGLQRILVDAVHPHSEVTVPLRFVVGGRGLQAPPSIVVASSLPFGLWRMIAKCRLRDSLLVAPAPEPNPPPLPLTRGLQGGTPLRENAESDDAGLRPYLPGDSLTRISWRAAARTDGQLLASRYFEPESTAGLWIRQQDATANPADIEATLSRMAAWVLEAHRRKIPYGFVLGDAQITPACTDSHRMHCLRLLAIFKMDTAK